MRKRALVRLEDVGPGGWYGTEERLAKLRAVADMLQQAGVPFHVALVPRYVDPQAGYDKSIEQVDDPFIRAFLATIRYLQTRGASIGLHGYTHQYGAAASMAGFEFTWSECPQDCPPDDGVEAYLEREAFEQSYASSRLRAGFAAVERAGVQIEWFETPHYTASPHQRKIIESWSGVIYENLPDEAGPTHLAQLDLDTPLFRGVLYVPTPLFYLEGDLNADVGRMCQQIRGFAADDVASFFYHPYLEFDFLTLDPDTGAVTYDSNSYLHRLVRCFHEQHYAFVHLLQLTPFVPQARQTELHQLLAAQRKELFVGDFDGDGLDEHLAWEPSSGTWTLVKASFEPFPSRHHGGLQVQTLLTGWAVGEQVRPFAGDFNGDGRTDIAIWNPRDGSWQVALSVAGQLQPTNTIWLSDFAPGTDWHPLIGDFDGDGREELIAWHPATGEWRVALSTGTAFVHQGPWRPDWSIGSTWTVATGDFNGDGRTDLLAWNPDTGRCQVALTQCDHVQATDHVQPTASWLPHSNVSPHAQLLIGDFNGDGYDDVLFADLPHGRWQLATSTGQQFLLDRRLYGPWCSGHHVAYAGRFHHPRVASLSAYHPHLHGGTLDFAVSTAGRNVSKKGVAF